MTSDNRLKRLQYQHGMVLSAGDFSAEQEYFLRRQRRHNRFMHGWGVVSGLWVTVVDDEVLIEPGMAIDCAGNEIFLEERETRTLPAGAGGLYVVVEYSESEVDPVPIAGIDNADRESTAYSRIAEGKKVYLMDDDPLVDHDEMPPGTPGCNGEHPVPIARITVQSVGTAVALCGRR